jgi:hypothetical protein
MHEDRVIKPGRNNRRIYQARGTLSIICELISEPLALRRQGETIGELAGRSSPIGRSYPARADARIWIWLMKNTLKLSHARSDVHDIIYTRCKRTSVHWERAVLEIRDVD